MAYGLPPTEKCGPAPCNTTEATLGWAQICCTARRKSSPRPVLNELK